MNTLVVYQAIVTRVDILAKFFAVLLSLLEVQRQPSGKPDYRWAKAVASDERG